MSHSQGRLSLKRAFGFSLALHLMLAPFILTSAIVAFDVTRDAHGEETTERTRVSYLQVEHRRPVALPRRVVPVARPIPSAIRVVRTNVPPVASRARTRFASRVAPNVPRLHDASVPGGVPESHPRAAQPDSAVAQTRDADAEQQSSQPSATTDATAEPAATPAAQVVETAARGIDVPPGGWGQSFEKPLVADDAALADLRARYHASSAVTVEVDEAGHAIRIVLPSDLAGDARAELEKRLRELRYVPAECNGLRCGGTLQILL